jgi:hypothetical protein
MYSGLGQEFFNAQGQVITSILCGQPYTLDIPGHPPGQVWLRQFKNQQPQYEGPFTIPMAPYTSNCKTEVGVYHNDFFELAADGTRGAYIGSVQFSVLPNPQQVATPVSVPVQEQAAPAATFVQVGAPQYTGSGYTPSGGRIVATGVQVPAPTIVAIPGQPPQLLPPELPQAAQPAGGGFDLTTWLLIAAVSLGAISVLRR